MKTIKPILFFAVILSLGLFSACWSADSNRTARSDGNGSTPSSTTSSSQSPSSNKSPNGNNSTKVNNSTTNPPNGGGFQGNLPSGFQMPSDPVGQKMFKEYGAMFVAKGVTPPGKVVFANEGEVATFQSSVQKASENIGGVTIELQTAAMNDLKAAIAEAGGKSLSITPRNADSGKRSFQQTVDNWKSRVDPGLVYWVGKGRISQGDADRIRGLSAVDQIPEIFKLEDQGIFFAQGNQKTIIYSVAPPGTSQHISMFALDVTQHDNARVREVLANHGWFQTIPSDVPHFTYLGVKESELPGLGLKKVTEGGRTFWVPNI